MIYDIDGKKQDNVSYGNKADISETRLPRRVQPIHYGVNYHKDPLQFKLIFGAQEALDRYDLEAIALWLTGYQDYQWLTICQPDQVLTYRCLIKELTPIAISWLPVAFEAAIVCDCQYAYGYEFHESYLINGSGNVLLRNDSSVREYLKPELLFVPSGGSGGSITWRIINHSDGDREFRIAGIPSGSTGVHVDCANGIITEQRYDLNLYDGYNMNMFRLVQGDNLLEIYGSGTTTISGRTLHNVSA